MIILLAPNDRTVFSKLVLRSTQSIETSKVMLAKLYLRARKDWGKIRFCYKVYLEIYVFYKAY